MAALKARPRDSRPSSFRARSPCKTASIRDAIATTKDFPGATGNITINAERNADKAIVIVQVKDKKFTYHSMVNATPSAAAPAPAPAPAEKK